MPNLAVPGSLFAFKKLSLAFFFTTLILSLALMEPMDVTFEASPLARMNFSRDNCD